MRFDMAGWRVNVARFYFAFQVRTYAVVVCTSIYFQPPPRAGGWKRGLNKYSTTPADRARDFSCLREGNKEKGWRVERSVGLVPV